jgi:hypothetical protein
MVGSDYTFAGTIATHLNVDNRTRAALHAPISKDWAQNSAYTFGAVFFAVYLLSLLFRILPLLKGAGPGASALEDPSKCCFPFRLSVPDLHNHVGPRLVGITKTVSPVSAKALH